MAHTTSDWPAALRVVTAALAAPPPDRQAILDAHHLRSAEEVLATMGQLKGAVMKLA
jgi:hypothetical protein